MTFDAVGLGVTTWNSGVPYCDETGDTGAQTCHDIIHWSSTYCKVQQWFGVVPFQNLCNVHSHYHSSQQPQIMAFLAGLAEACPLLVLVLPC